MSVENNINKFNIKIKASTSFANDLRTNILNIIVPLARSIIPDSIDETGKLKPEYELFVVNSILAYQNFEQVYLKNLLNKDNG